MTGNENNTKPERTPRVLIYGFGNPGRQDDGLGVMLVDEVKKWSSDIESCLIETDQNYQLNIEDSSRITAYDLVIFTDASVADITNFALRKVTPDLTTNFSMHSVTPSFVVGLCSQIFGICPESYELHIRGYKWEFMKGITNNAKKNLKEASKFICQFIKEKYDDNNL